MEIRKIDDDYSVTGQIEIADIADIKAAGYKGLICNRPDNEAPGQPLADAVGDAARQAGLEFRYLPVISGRIVEDDVTAQAQALQSMPKPVLAYCRSGGRCTNLYGLIQQPRGSRQS